jgi:purine-cytosine permease-like protein
MATPRVLLSRQEQSTRGSNMPVWAWILIILLIVFLLGGFGYSRR